MKQATFFEGVGFALLASLAGAAGFGLLAGMFVGGNTYLVITLLALAYVLYLLKRSRERIGRVTVVLAWCLVTITSWALAPGLLVYALIQVGMIWLIRSLYYYGSVVSSLTDLGLTALGLAVAVWAWHNTHSLFVSFWSFFLVQALFVFIPKTLARRHDKRLAVVDIDAFERAHDVAESAVRRLTSTH